MIGRTHSAYLEGTSAEPLCVEAEPTTGVAIELVGLHERSARETRLRADTAMVASELRRPHAARVTLLPLQDRRAAPHLDLAVAVALHAAVAKGLRAGLRDTLLVGELGLAGALRPCRGLLPMLVAARESGLARAVVPHAQLDEARLVDGIEVFGAKTLRQVVSFLAGEDHLPRTDPWEATGAPVRSLPPLPGLEPAMTALRAAAAGGHSVLLVGAFASGKTMLARRVPALMPAPTPNEALTIATCRSAAGLDVRVERPFRAPHHTASETALLGGGDPVRPGEVTLAHEGVLLLDELPEFRRGIVDAVLGAVRRGEVVVRRRGDVVTMPARALVIGAMNPCPCGRLGDGTERCRCSAAQIATYLARVPVERFDIVIRLSPAAAWPHRQRDDRRLYRVAATLGRLDGRAHPCAADIAAARELT